MVNPVFTVVAYDISDNKRRKRVSDILEHYGMRVNYSVFECDLTSAQKRDLKKEILRVIREGDDVRYYSLCRNCRRKRENAGGSSGGKSCEDGKGILVV